MTSSAELCVVCAWRETCVKKFNLSGRVMHCPDFTMDVTIKAADEGQSDEEGATK